LRERREILEKIFQIPTWVSIEPDSIAEKVPKILQLWYNEFVKKKNPSAQCSRKKVTLVEPSPLSRLFKYPTQSFRLIIVGMFIGFIGTIFTLSLLLMNSKSKKHTDLKFGVSLGNIASFSLIIIASFVFSIFFYNASNQVYCSKCELIVSSRNSSDATRKLYNTIPLIEDVYMECYNYNQCLLNKPPSCTSCMCFQIYFQCQTYYRNSILLAGFVGLFCFFIAGTAFMASRFTRNESFSMSLL